LFATFLLTGFREQEVMFLRWSDVNFELRTVRVTSKPELGFYPKRWEDREIPAPVELIEELRKHMHRPNCQFVFPSPTGNREQHMLDHCKSIAKRARNDLPRAALEKPSTQGISVACPHHCTASAAPCFRDADAGRRLSKGARNLRLLGRRFRTGS
jgi:integrase